jgi:uroporphyrinogen III methyltransferase/synthase
MRPVAISRIRVALGGLAYHPRMNALVGKRVLVTRAREQAGATAELLRARGAVPVVVPTIVIGPPSDAGPMRRAVEGIARYAWVALTSVNGAGAFFDEVKRQGRGLEAKIAVVGTRTAAAVEARGARVEVVAADARGEGLADAMLRAFAGATPRVLVARAEVAREVLPDALRAAGCEVDVVAFYATRTSDTASAEIARAIDGGTLDAVLFTSGSTVDNLCDALGPSAHELLSRLLVASIGPVTSDAARARGVHVDVVANEATIEALVDALEGAFSARA